MNPQRGTQGSAGRTWAKRWCEEAKRQDAEEDRERALAELQSAWEVERDRAIRWRAAPTHPVLWQGEDGRCAWDLLSENQQTTIAPWMNTIDTEWIPAHILIRGLNDRDAQSGEIVATLRQRAERVGPRMVAMELKPELGPSKTDTVHGIGQWLRIHRAKIDTWRWVELCAGRDGRRWSAQALESTAIPRGNEAQCAQSALSTGEDDPQGCTPWLHGWPAEIAKRNDATVWVNAVLRYAIRRHDASETLRALDEGAKLELRCEMNDEATADRLGTWDGAPIALVAKLRTGTLEWNGERILESAGANGNERWMRGLLMIECSGTDESPTSRERIRRWARALRRGAIRTGDADSVDAALRATEKNTPGGDDLLDAIRGTSVEIAESITKAIVKGAKGHGLAQAFRYAATQIGRAELREGCAQPQRQAVLRTVAEAAAQTEPGLRSTLHEGVFENDWGWITSATGEAPAALYTHAGPDAILEPSDPAWRAAIEAMEEAAPDQEHPGLYAEEASAAVAQALGSEKLAAVRLVRSDEALGEESGAAVACAIGRAQKRKIAHTASER